MKRVIVSGAFSEINLRMFRFLHEASRHGRVQVLLWTDELIEKLEGFLPRFSFEERAYVLDSLRYVDSISPAALRSPSNAALKKFLRESDVFVQKGSPLESGVKRQKIPYRSVSLFISTSDW